jgi:hypothetical protein
MGSAGELLRVALPLPSQRIRGSLALRSLEGHGVRASSGKLLQASPRLQSSKGTMFAASPQPPGSAERADRVRADTPFLDATRVPHPRNPRSTVHQAARNSSQDSHFCRSKGRVKSAKLLQKLLAFACKACHFCLGYHRRKVLQTCEWIARSVFFEVPHRRFVFTMSEIRSRWTTYWSSRTTERDPATKRFSRPVSKRKRSGESSLCPVPGCLKTKRHRKRA